MIPPAPFRFGIGLPLRLRPLFDPAGVIPLRVTVGILLLAVATVCVILSLLATLLGGVLGIVTLILASKRP